MIASAPPTQSREDEGGASPRVLAEEVRALRFEVDCRECGAPLVLDSARVERDGYRSVASASCTECRSRWTVTVMLTEAPAT